MFSSQHFSVRRSLLIPQLVHSLLLILFFRLQSEVCIHRESASMNSYTIASSANLTFLGFLTSLVFKLIISTCGSVCPISSQNSSIFVLPRAFVHLSAGFASVATFSPRVCFAAMRSCNHSILVCMRRVLLPAPLRDATALALEESVCSVICNFKFQSANKLCSPNPAHPSFC